jgi:hypothetical protein
MSSFFFGSQLKKKCHFGEESRVYPVLPRLHYCARVHIRLRSSAFTVTRAPYALVAWGAGCHAR